MDQQNNAFVTAIHARTDPAGRKNLILDLNGTNSIVGQGRIAGLGNRVNNATFPGCFDRDTPRVLTISNVNNVSLYWLLSGLPVLPDLLISEGPGAGQVTLTWTAPGWSLQTSPNVAMPNGWTDTARTSPARFNVTPGNQFFRLKSP
jgi:hypothetical protein